MSEIYSTLSYWIKVHGEWQSVVKHLTEQEHKNCLAGKYMVEGHNLLEGYNVRLEVGVDTASYGQKQKTAKKSQPNKKWYQSPRSRW